MTYIPLLILIMIIILSIVYMIRNTIQKNIPTPDSGEPNEPCSINEKKLQESFGATLQTKVSNVIDNAHIGFNNKYWLTLQDRNCCYYNAVIDNGNWLNSIKLNPYTCLLLWGRHFTLVGWSSENCLCVFANLTRNPTSEVVYLGKYDFSVDNKTYNLPSPSLDNSVNPFKSFTLNEYGANVDLSNVSSDTIQLFPGKNWIFRENQYQARVFPLSTFEQYQNNVKLPIPFNLTGTTALKTPSKFCAGTECDNRDDDGPKDNASVDFTTVVYEKLAPVYNNEIIKKDIFTCLCKDRRNYIGKGKDFLDLCRKYNSNNTNLFDNCNDLGVKIKSITSSCLFESSKCFLDDACIPPENCGFSPEQKAEMVSICNNKKPISCTNSKDCSGGKCLNGECVSLDYCNTSADCSSIEQCYKNTCKPLDYCIKDSDCESNSCNVDTNKCNDKPFDPTLTIILTIISSVIFVAGYIFVKLIKK